MAKSTLFLPELENALWYWEDVNIISQILFSLSIKKDSIPEKYKYQRPLIGSEIDEGRILRRSIKNFRGLRSCLESMVNFDPLQFLPRVPTEVRENYDQINLLRSEPYRSIAFFPYFIGEWQKYRKVYAIQKVSSIEILDPLQKNFLPYLPYGSFVINFIEPLSLHFSEKNSISYSTMMVVLHEQDDVIDVLLLPEDFNPLLLTNEDRKFLEARKEGHLSKIKLFNGGGVFGTAIDVEKGLVINSIDYEETDEGIVHYIHPINLGDSSTISEDSRRPYKEILGFINGFCKMVSEFPPRKQILDKSPSEQFSTESPNFNDYGWNSVPITEVRNLNDLGADKIYVSGNSTGGEKCPHWRRGHWRTIKHSELIISVARIIYEQKEHSAR